MHSSSHRRRNRQRRAAPKVAPEPAPQPLPVRAAPERKTSSGNSFLRSLRLGMFTALAISAGVIGFQFWQTNGDGFTVSRIETSTDGNLSSERILALARVPGDASIFRLDLDEVEQRLASYSYIRSAKLERKLPDILRIEVSERKPIAWLVCPELGIYPEKPNLCFVLDAEGVALNAELLESWPNEELPWIMANRLEKINPGEPLEVPSLRSACALLEIWAPNPDLGLGFPIKLTQMGGFAFEAELEHGLRVTFAARDLDRQLADLELILENPGTQNKQLATVNLLMQKNIAVTYEVPNGPARPLRPISGLSSRAGQ